MLALAAGVIQSLGLLRLRPLKSQNPDALLSLVREHDENGDYYWDDPEIKRGRALALALAKSTKSIAELRNEVAKIQNSLLTILITTIILIMVSTLIGIINI